MSDEDPIRGQNETIPTARELAMVLFRRRRVFVCISSLILAASLLYAIAGTKYQANMKVLVRRGRADAPVSAGINAPLDVTRVAITEEELNSEVELLRDQEIMRRVVEKTGVGGRDWFHFLRLNEGRPEQVERAARRLAQRIRIEPVKRTNLIAVSYAADSSQTAAKVLRSLADAYLEKHMAVHRPEGELRFFEQQTAESRQQLEDANRRLLWFSKSHGVVAASQQRDLTLQRLSELDAGERQTHIELAETRQRVRELEEQVLRLPERTTTQVRTADNPDLLKALKATLLDLQLKRTQLLTKFEPNHRLVQEIDQQITQTQAAVAGESSSPVRDETTDKNPHYEWARAELQRAQVQLRALEARESATTIQGAICRALAAKLGEDAIAQEDLLGSERVAQENYLLYVKKKEESRLNDALDERGIVNVAIAEQPAAPALPVFSAWTVLALGLLGAGIGGAGAAFVADHLDPAFRDPEDVRAYLNVPVLASLPRGRYRKLSA